MNKQAEQTLDKAHAVNIHQDSEELLRQRYMEMVSDTLPNMSKSRDWPIRFDHCFARVILDQVFQGCWYDHIDRKKGAAYKQLNSAQLLDALTIAGRILQGPDEVLVDMNKQSLRWRGKL